MLPRVLGLLGRLRRHSGLAGRKLFAHQPGVHDRRCSGGYVLPPCHHRPPRRYDADGNELRSKPR